jgi:2-dehydropantoate 2-reductase
MGTEHHRFLVYGAGAIGSVFGGMLARGGNRVDLVGRPAHVEAVRKRGLHIGGLLGEHVVHPAGAWTSLAELPSEQYASVVFICVKSSDTDAAVNDLTGSGLIGEGTLIVSLQNGLGNLEQIRQAFGQQVSYGGRVIFGSEFINPGKVFVSVWADDVLIGGPTGKQGRENGKKLAAELTRCGIKTRYTDDIEAALWGKVLYNVGLNPLSAILEVPYGELGLDKNARDLLEHSIREAFRVARKETRLIWKDEEEYLDHFFQQLLPATGSHHSSMLQDLESGRETEIEAITGEVIRRAGKYGISVPVNAAIYRLLKAKVGMKGMDRSRSDV